MKINYLPLDRVACPQCGRDAIRIAEDGRVIMFCFRGEVTVIVFALGTDPLWMAPSLDADIN